MTGAAPLVLVHGTPLDHHEWYAVRALLEPRHTVIAYDLRGHGSESAAGPAESFDALAGDLRALLDRLGVDRAHLVGHSFGGQVAQRFAVTQPGRVERLTVVCSRAAPFPPFGVAADRVDEGELEAVAQGALVRWFGQDQVDAGGAAVAYARACLEAIDPAVFAGALRLIAGFDGMEALAGLTMPTRWIAAELDVVGTPDHMRECADAAPNAGFTLIPGHGHMLPVTDPALLADALD